ncbi:hypothetical protein [Methanococcus vannielii]|nr:hypothetical protein [Methanococcus vannielii]
MILTEKKIIFFSVVFVVLGSLFLTTYELTPSEKPISHLKDGDFVKITSKIQRMDVNYNEYREVIGIKSVRLMDETASDLRLYISTEISKEFLEYTLKTDPRIKEGDIVRVTGKINVYNGLYGITLKDISNFEIVEKLNFEKDILFSKVPTKYYASKSSKSYHTHASCSYGLKINEKVYFINEEDALNLGYKKCSYCEKRD